MFADLRAWPYAKRGFMKLRSVGDSGLAALVAAALSFLPGGAGCAADWPMWRHDAARSGASPEELAETLHLLWFLELPTPKPAWPRDQKKLLFDRLYEPVLAGKSLFVPSMISDKLTAYDTDTGEEKWSFFAEGPLRFAPVVWRDRVFFNCDDGCLYCLDTATGALLWRLRGGPSERLVLGQGRLISTWPARGACCLYDGTLYFGAGIWPFQGIFLYAVDAETGTVVWGNSGTGSSYIVQPHSSPSFAGVAPQGYIAATKQYLVVAGGRTLPAVFDRHSGRLLHYNVGRYPRGGGYEVTALEEFFLNRDNLYRLSNGELVATVGAPVVTDYGMIGADDGGLRGYKPRLQEIKTADRRGDTVEKTALQTSWTAALAERIEEVVIQSGSRLYCVGEKNSVLAIDLPRLGRGAQVSWKVELPDVPLNMLTGDGKLFVTTDAGRVYAFSEKPSAKTIPPIQKVTLHRTRPRFAPDRWRRLARSILGEVAVDDGYCVALGLGSGRLVEEVISQSRFHVVVLESDATKADSFRRRMDALGVYGTRVAVRVGDAETLELPPYMADLVVAEDPEAAGFPGSLTGKDGEAFVRRVFRTLRPYTGVACLSASEDERKLFARLAGEAELDHGVVDGDGDLAILRRLDAPAGSGHWTHQYGDATNRNASSDLLVKAPLGLLWFGGPSNEEVLPRHGHGPTPQVVDGRLIIEGRHILRATDIYTGRLLWERELENLGASYDYTNHAPGANLIGSNYVSLGDGIYVLHDDRCLRLDPRTGETISEFYLPVHPGEEEGPTWGYLGISADVLVAGVTFDVQSADFDQGDFSRMGKEVAKGFTDRLFELKDFERVHPGKDREAWSLFLVNANKLLLDERTVERIPAALRQSAKTDELEQELAAYLRRPGQSASDEAALRIKRKILAKCYGLPDHENLPVGTFRTLTRSQSRKLVAMNRHSGRLLWEFAARHQIRHNSVALGAGKAFCIDQLSSERMDHYRRRGTRIEEEPRLVALDLESGKVLWSTSRRVFGTWLSYSEEHDALLQAGSRARDRGPDEVGKGMVVYRASTGEVLWENDLEYSGPCILLSGLVLTQARGRFRGDVGHPGFALDILTGERKTRSHGVSGEETPWQYDRNYGCNTAIGAPHLLTFRSAAAGYCDLEGDSGTGNFGGFRSGCTTNLIPAGGVLTAPDYTRTCTCAYQNQSSLALVHAPDVEMWTFNRYPYDFKPVRHVGLNFGAPGDRRSPDGTLWLDVPSVGGESPDIPVELFSGDRKFLRVHPRRIEGGELPWVGASAVEGEVEIVVQLVTRMLEAVPNEVDGAPALRTRNAVSSPSVALRRVPGNGLLNDSSLSRGAGDENLSAVVPRYSDLEAPSITVEYWIRGQGDFAHIDARGQGQQGNPLEQGFVIDKEQLRLRYFVARADDTDNEPVVLIESEARISPQKWSHVAFTYEAEKGVGSLYLDGRLVGLRDGPDGRALWWEKEPGDLVFLGAETGEARIDEVRVCNKAIGRDAFLNQKGTGGAAHGVVGYWRMEAAHGENKERSSFVYTVRLVFAELEGRDAGERLFDVLLEGEPVLEAFDIAAAAGGAYRTVTKEFRGVSVDGDLHVQLTRKGQTKPLLSGIQILAEADRDRQPAQGAGR
jgi:outer membrane protein assembly factor BamB